MEKVKIRGEGRKKGRSVGEGLQEGSKKHRPKSSQVNHRHAAGKESTYPNKPETRGTIHARAHEVRKSHTHPQVVSLGAWDRV